MKRFKFTDPPVAKLLGFRLVRRGRDSAVCAMQVKKQHVNMIGTAHGGILCDLSDAAMGFAFAARLGAGRIGVTVEFKINFLRPAFPTDRLVARAKVLSGGKNLSYLECEIRNAAGRLVAKAASTCALLPATANFNPQAKMFRKPA